MNNGQGKMYSTLDAYQAAFLSINGHVPALREEPSGKVAFYFGATDDLFQCINAYNGGAQCVALQLALTVKGLKAQIFSTRRRNDDRHRYTREK